MKRINGQNIGQNIITSSDITLEGEINGGKTLEEVLEEQSSEIEKLKSNVKWIYKYGGVGGNGRGPGPSGSWSIFARLGDAQIVDKETLVFPQAGQYNLLIRINNPSGGTFMVSYTYMSAGGTPSTRRNIRLDIENAWTLEETINLGGNYFIRIDVLDENNETKTLESNYITQSYTLKYELVEGNSPTIPFIGDRIFMNSLKSIGGLQIKLSYEVIDDVKEFSYEYTRFGDTETISETISTETESSKKGTILLNAFTYEDIKEIPENFIGTFSTKLKVTILKKESNFSKSLTILPDRLYLQVEPMTGEIYDGIIEDVDSVIKYLPGTITFLITAYCGSSLVGRNVQYWVSTYTNIDQNTSPETIPNEDWTNVIEAGSLQEQTPSRITLRFSQDKVGWNVIKFVAKNLSNGETISKYVYIYIDQFSSQLNWYPKYLQSEDYNNKRSYFRDGLSGEMDPGFHINSPNGPKLLETISMTKNSDTVLLFPDNNPNDMRDCVIHIGIQYNSTSDNNNKILDIAYYDGSTPPNSSNIDSGVVSEATIHVYQNIVYMGANYEKIGDIYLGTELEKYDASAAENYHLITICRRYVGNFQGSYATARAHFEICVYIDGVLETACPSFSVLQAPYNLIRLYKNNYSINTLELSFYPHLGNENEDSFNYDYITDTGVVHYWYTYKEQLQRIPPSTDIVELLETFEGDRDNNRRPGIAVDQKGHVKLESGIIDDIVKGSDVPVMLITYDDRGGMYKFFDWSDKIYGDASVENQSKAKLTVGVKWAPAEASSLSSVNYQNTTFSLAIQGSSTKIYTSKNYTLRLEGEIGSGNIPLFSPNFDPNDTNTFLPEQSFTLKADVVDSGHSNNTCIGSFINRVTEKYSDARLGGGMYTNFIKNCLEGFPFLLFVGIQNEGGIQSNDINYYYLGIYNFNLGRKSFFNLGYSDVTKLPSNITSPEGGGGFRFCSVNSADCDAKNTFTCAEIAFNEGWFDFSVYDESILFSKKDAGDTKFMFDDIESGESTEGAYQGKIKEFVKATSKAGGFIFDTMNKTYVPHEKGYGQKDSVPEHNKYYKKVISGGSIFFEEDESQTQSMSTPTKSDLLRYVGISESNSGEEEIGFTADYRSLVEYYTICMAFGLVDSVQKNLTIKTWDGKKFYFAFYDMDTSLGIDNNGNSTTYYAFSDLWEYNPDTNSTNTHDDIVTVNKPVSIYRDYFSPSDTFTPAGQKLVGYDTASSYAFAVAKYFTSVTKSSDRQGKDISPASLWARWRNKRRANENGFGYLRDADYFIDNYFLTYMKDVNELMFNYNYRQKYLRKATELTELQTYYGFSYSDIPRFHGRRTEYIRDWLSGRFHILDAYLNITSTPSPLDLNAPGYSYLEAMPNSEIDEIDSSNEDIYVLRDIFFNGSESLTENKSFIIQAPDFSPFIVFRGNAADRYLLPDSRKKYSFSLDNTGTNKVILGGSALWTYLNTIDGVIQPNMKIHSNRLKNINGSSGTVTAWDIVLPALEEVKLTSPGYSGQLRFDASGKDIYPNLTTIDINSSNISLTVIKEGVKKIILNKVGSTTNSAPDINIIDCMNLTDVQISEARLNSLTISPVWSNNINLTDNNIKTITLVSRFENSVLNISDFGLETLNVSEFSKIVIHDCPKLRTIVSSGSKLTELSIQEGAAPLLENITIEDCSNLTTLSLNGCMNLYNLKLNKGVTKIINLDLSRTSISYITYPALGDDGNTMDCLDLTPMTSLKKLTIRGNPSVTKIRVRNVANDPVEFNAGSVYVNQTEFCSLSLQKIYGHIRITTTGALSKLNNKFRLLPTTTIGNTEYTYFQGTQMFGNRLPLQVASGITKVDPLEPSEIEEVHTNVCREFDKVLSGSDGKSFFDNSVDATNITFGNERQIGKVLASICAGTPIPQYEIYYILNAFAVSAQKCKDRGGTVAEQSLSLSFWYMGGNRFNYTNNNSMHPNRYMFYGCSDITELDDYCIATTATATKLIAPSHNSDGSIVCNNGLFSPLTKLKKIGNLIGGAQRVYISRFLFRREDGEYYPIQKSIGNFQANIVCDDVDTNTKNSVDALIDDPNNVDVGKLGDFTDFFLNFGSTSAPIDISRSFNSTYINFDTIDLPSRIKVNNVIDSFHSTYGCGTINLFDENKKIFKTTENIEQIVRSFIVDNKNENYQESVNRIRNTNYNTGGRVLFPIKDGMFSGYGKLKYIGAVDERNSNNSSTSGYTDITIESSINGNASTLTRTGFSGDGLLKYIDQDSFPYDLFTSIKDTLETCPGFMSELDVYGNSLNNTFYFPGTLFEGTKHLTDVAAFLKNCKISYELTGGGFSNCENLQNISEIFYGELGINNKCSNLTGSIPNKLFYHGGTANSISDKTFYGTNSDIDLDNPPDTSEYWGNSDHEITITFPEKFTYNRSIIRAYAAFRGCARIEPYSMRLEEGFGKEDPTKEYIIYLAEKSIKLNTKAEYTNYNYTHWKYYTNGSQWFKGDTNLLDISLIYDGDIADVSTEIQGISTCEENFKTKKVIGEYTDYQQYLTSVKTAGNVTKFFSSPDLFSYFTDNAFTNIQYMFSHCGLPASTSIKTDNFNIGMTGRICPYLLKPIPNIGSLAGMFMYCSGLSSVKFVEINASEQQIDEASTFLIPENFFTYAKNIQYLPKTFSGLWFEHWPSLKNVFSPLANKVNDIRGIFAWCMYTKKDDNPNNSFIPIANVFSNNFGLGRNVSGAFSAYPIGLKIIQLTDGGVIVDTTAGIGLRTKTYKLFGSNFNLSVKGNMERIYNVYRGHGLFPNGAAEDEFVYNASVTNYNY